MKSGELTVANEDYNISNRTFAIPKSSAVIYDTFPNAFRHCELAKAAAFSRFGGRKFSRSAEKLATFPGAGVVKFSLSKNCTICRNLFDLFTVLC